MINIFSLSSRLGMYNKPFGGEDTLNIGVEEGANSILTKEFRDNLPEHKVIEFQFSDPSTLKEEESYHTFARESIELRNIISMFCKPNDIQITIGGDHSSSLAGISSILDRKKGKIGYIQVDSHTDLHLKTTSPSGNIHGMWARVFMDEFDNKQINSIAPVKIPTSNVLYIGNLVMEEEEKRFVEEKKIKTISKVNLDNSLKNVEKWITSFDHLHVSFDIDSMDKTVAPATGIPAEDGLTDNQALKLIDIVKKHNSLSFDLVEVNPKKEGADQTIAFAQLLLQKLLV